MKKTIKDLRRMKYFKNYAASSGAVHNIAKHEDAVEDVLHSHGLKCLDRKIKIADRDEMLMTGLAPTSRIMYLYRSHAALMIVRTSL